MSAPISPEQEARLREIVREELAAAAPSLVIASTNAFRSDERRRLMRRTREEVDNAIAAAVLSPRPRLPARAARAIAAHFRGLLRKRGGSARA